MRTDFIRKITLAIFAIITIVNYCAAQTERDSMLIGKISAGQWKDHETWDTGDYSPDKEVTAAIKQALTSDTDIFLFAGTWCSDSRKNVPQIYRLFDELGISGKVEFYGVDRDKLEPEGKSLIMGLEKVPTIIVLKAGKEIGRITEYPSESWEKDLLHILTQ